MSRANVLKNPRHERSCGLHAELVRPGTCMTYKAARSKFHAGARGPAGLRFTRLAGPKEVRINDANYVRNKTPGEAEANSRTRKRWH